MQAVWPIKAQYRQWLVVLLMSFSAFSIYTCMYAMRKPYTALSYNGLMQFGISYKVVLVVSQVMGYMCSKLIGIKFISEINHAQRKKYILLCILSGWFTLLLFALLPFSIKFIALFLNGLPLGLVWGLVFGYLEGRRFTDLMGAILSVSFIFSSGFTKTVCKYFDLHSNISVWFLPFLTGTLFIIPLLFFTKILHQLPPPNVEDRLQKNNREPMNKQDRQLVIKQFIYALIPAVLSYMLLTVLRDFIEDFSNELWIETGYSNSAAIFTQTATFTSLLVIVIIALFFMVKNNYKAFININLLILFGFVWCILATFLFQKNYINVVVWIIMASTGLYLGYVAKNCLYYERFIAAYKVKGNVGFVMYLADSIGYLGTICVLLLKEFFVFKINWVNFFTMAFYTASIAGIVWLGIAMQVFKKIYTNKIYNK